jgi:hypothetical protein
LAGFLPVRSRLQSVLMLIVWWFCIRVLSFLAMKFIKYGRN